MSKPVRIRGDVAVRVGELAGSERRPFANMVEVLLLEALGSRNGAAVPGFAAVGPEYPDELEEAAALEERGSGTAQRSLRPRSSSAEPAFQVNSRGKRISSCPHGRVVGVFCPTCDKEKA